MPFPLLLAIGGGLGLGKHALEAGAAARDRKLQAETARYSPWTGLKPQKTQDPNIFGNLLQGATVASMAGGMGGAGDMAGDVASEAPALGSSQASSLGVDTNMGNFSGLGNRYSFLNEGMQAPMGGSRWAALGGFGGARRFV